MDDAGRRKLQGWLSFMDRHRVPVPARLPMQAQPPPPPRPLVPAPRAPRRFPAAPEHRPPSFQTGPRLRPGERAFPVVNAPWDPQP